MKYEDPLIDESEVGNVNVSSEPPLKTFVKLLAALLIILAVGYACMNVMIYQVVRHVSFETEKKYFTTLSESLLDGIADTEHLQQTQALQRIADKLRDRALAADSNHPLKNVQITMHYSDNATVNAFAMPAGHVVVMRGLIEAMPDENMLAMVIGHEIGHVIHRDSLQRLGRVTLTNMVLLALLGSDSPIIGQTTLFMEGGYSRKAESRADIVGLELLASAYGQVSGAAELFDIFADMQPQQSRWLELSSTHPLPVNRRQAIEELIKQRGYSTAANQSQPMPSALQFDCRPCQCQ